MKALPMFEPMHPARKAWDVIRLLAVLWEGFVTPVTVLGRDPTFFLATFWTDLVFIMTIAIDLNTRAYNRFGTRTETRADIIRFRLRQHFFVDLVAAIPYHVLAWVLARQTASWPVVGGMNISMFVHALGIFRVVYLFNVIERLFILLWMDISLLRPTKQTIVLLLALHWFGFPLMYMSGISMRNDAIFSGPFFERYLYILYFTSSTFIPAGYGDISMKTSDARLLVILLMALGIVSYLLWTVLIVRIHLEERLRENPLSGRSWVIRQYLDSRQCGPKLQQRIQDWFLLQSRNSEKDFARFEYAELPPSYRYVVAKQLAQMTMPEDSSLFHDLLKVVSTVLPSNSKALSRFSAIDDRFFIVTCGEVICYDPDSGSMQRHGPDFTFGGTLFTSLKSVCEIVCSPDCELLVFDLLSVQRIVNASTTLRPALRNAVHRYCVAVPDKGDEPSVTDPVAGAAVLAIADRLPARECRAVLRTAESRRLRLHLYQMFCSALAKVLERYDELHNDLQEILLQT